MTILLCIMAVILGALAGKLFGKTFTPDAFGRDAYAYLTNQLAHMVLGVCLTLPPMVIGYFITGELPSRLLCFCVIFCAYIAFELMQNGETRDIIEDTIFVVVYGAGIVLYNFRWTSYSSFEGDVFYFVPCITAIALHLFLGCKKRQWKDDANDNMERD